MAGLTRSEESFETVTYKLKANICERDNTRVDTTKDAWVLSFGFLCFVASTVQINGRTAKHSRSAVLSTKQLAWFDNSTILECG